MINEYEAGRELPCVYNRVCRLPIPAGVITPRNRVYIWCVQSYRQCGVGGGG